MPWKAAFLLLAFPLFLSFKPVHPDPRLRKIEQRYHRADSLFNLPNADSAALAAFNELIPMMESLPSDAHLQDLLFQSYLKKAIESEVRSDDLGAKNAYLKAFNYQSEDSHVFQLNIYTGCIYYKLNNFDSANYYLLKAESLVGKDASPDDKIRLFNTLGVLYYDNGNYLHCRNYFNEALQVLKSTHHPDKATAASLQTNIATACFRLGMYQASLDMYKRGLQYHVFADQIYINMGRSNAGLMNYPAAMACFRKVNPRQLPGVLNEMANVKLKAHDYDSAGYYLDLFERLSGGKYQLDEGFNETVRADLQMNLGEQLNALNSLQRAIHVFSGNFNDKNIRSNPQSFTGTFAYHGLFDALSKKASCWEQRYGSTHNPQDLVASLNAYDATLMLLSYIEKSYDMDDAKLLFKAKSGHLFEQAFQVCITLDHLYPDSNYLEKAFFISEKNKASVISSNLKQRSFLPATPRERELLQQERNIKFNISRLSAKTENSFGETVSSRPAKNDKSQYEIELTRVQKQLEKSNRYYRLKYEDDHASIGVLQSKLDNHQALISFSNAPDAIHVFIITKNAFKYFRIDHPERLAADVTDWDNKLRMAENGRKFESGEAGARLYNHLVQPIQQLTKGTDQWIVIPDGIFYFLPFESLPADGSGTSLLETTAISYQFSSGFLAHESPQPVALSSGALSFAPFADSGADFNSQGVGYLSKLPGSSREIKDLKGLQFLGSRATKQAFIEHLNQYPVIHLATHAVSEISDPAASFIAFYPATGKRPDDCLFIDELYGLSMDSCRLMIISACETGSGQLVNQEGIMSLSRAFMYAGCPSTVNSLWKADDDATAIILKKFHAYLQKGYVKSRALQQAKLDFIKENPLQRSPAYWSHLILTGDDSPLYKQQQPWEWAALSLIVMAGVVLVIKIRNRKEKNIG